MSPCPINNVYSYRFYVYMSGREWGIIERVTVTMYVGP